MTLARGWADNEVATIRQLWVEGKSAGIIAQQLPGRSRNSVIGKAARLGLSRTGQPSVRIYRHGMVAKGKRHEKKGQVRSKERLLPRPYTVQPEYIPADPIRFLDRTMDQCAFIAGDPKVGALAPEIQCCGAPAVFGGSWCAHHIKAVYAIQPPRRDRRSDNGKSPSRFIWEGA